ncbi:MAG: SpoIID/LytB domain-containing protein [Mycobacteriales bacterium]
MRRPLPARRSAVAAAAALLGSLLTSVVTAAPALADEVYERPANGVFAVEGHGWGHGHGMSQWGAQGAASQGADADTITATYYPGTARATIASRPIRVLLQADEGRDTQVYAAAGLTVTDLATGETAPLPDGPTRWRATVDSAGLHLQSLTGSTWSQAVITAGSTTSAYAGPLRFAGPTFVRVAFPNGTSRDYRGGVQAVATGSSTLQTVDVLSLEDYLLGVVPRESSSSWQPAALQAQAIAARSYSAYKRDHVAATARYDICDTTQCQVFGGSRLYGSDGSSTALEPASTTDAVRATAGVVRIYNGAPIFAEFSSSNGGWSTDGGAPYLVARRDDWDGAVQNSVHSWTASLRATDLQARFPSIGMLKRIRVTARDGNGEWGGRVKTVVLEGVDGSGNPTSVSTTGAGVYNARTWPANSDGLRSSWWHVTASTDASVVTKSVAPRLVRPPGRSTGTVTVTMKNVGSTTWSAPGLHLAVSSPPGQADALVGGSTRPGVLVRPTSGSIAPGETADFSFALDAAGVQPGTHGRTYRMRSYGGALFGAPVSWTIPVDPARFTAVAAAKPAAVRQPADDAPPDVFADGRTVVVPRTGSTVVRLQAKNTGNLIWPVGPTVLGTSGPRERESASYGSGWLSPKRPTRMTNTAGVGPGGVATFDLRLYGASKSVGVSAEAFEPAWESKHWLDGAVSSLVVVRTDPAVPRLASLFLAPPAKVTTSGALTLVVRLRNLGGTPWTVGREWLATAGSPDPLRTSGWPRPTRPPAMTRNVTRPGVAAVYPGEVGEWTIPLSGAGRAAGTYAEQWQAIGPDGRRFGPVLKTSVTVVH